MKKLVLIYRSIARNLKLSLINVLGMALGLVSAGIILGYVHQEFNYDSENPHSQEIYQVIEKDGEHLNSYTYAPLAEALKSNFPEVKATTRIGFFYGYLACSAGENKFNENQAIFADPDFFSLFSFPMVKGDREQCLQTPDAVVLSKTAAKKYFGNKNPIGQHLLIGGNNEFTVTGVYDDFKTNSNFRGNIVLPLKKISQLTQIWVEPSWKYESDIFTFVRLADNTKVHEFSAKAKNLISKFIPSNKNELLLQPLTSIHVDHRTAWESTPQANVKYLYILVAVAIIILVISAANFLFLYIGTMSQRSTDTSIKKVCGASRTTLFKEHLQEVSAMMFLSLSAAILLFVFYRGYLTKVFPLLPNINLFDWKLSIILLITVFLASLLPAIYPSFILASQKPASIFRNQGIFIPGKFKLINLLVIGQFLLSIILLISTFSIHKQTNYLENKKTGYAKNELLTIPLNMHIGEGIYSDKFDVFAGELKKYPGIKNVTMAFSSPASVETDEDAPSWEGRTKDQKVEMNWASVSYDYFKTLGVEIVEGRSFSPSFPSDVTSFDTHKSAYILNQSAVKAMGITNPIGKEFEVWGFKGPIIGVVRDYNFRSLRSGITPIFYQMNPFYLNEIIVRINPSDPAVLSDIRTVWDKFVPEYPLEFKFVDDQIKTLYRPEQNLAGTLNLFAIMAILIACTGLFTLTVLSVLQRTKEIGIRKVNGAKVSEVMTMLNKDFIKWVGIAFAIATPIAWLAMNKWLENFAYKTTLSWWIFALAGILALGIALLTVSWQSWKAATRNPVEALRYE
ncbi:ABC transporter permease [Prolixibacter sp. NT017]|uniref:ABC transporter permease n=1 Tax=Prolixibacter sp. NT017 TaxID=2652390 RepID=UPI001279ADC5|nr:ABC transporter permease [Prolixibacter sp. NT017]GET24640.1 ABC transporter permease [Prolixibacter sp. NT017]